MKERELKKVVEEELREIRKWREIWERKGGDIKVISRKDKKEKKGEKDRVGEV